LATLSLSPIVLVSPTAQRRVYHGNNLISAPANYGGNGFFVIFEVSGKQHAAFLLAENLV